MEYYIAIMKDNVWFFAMLFPWAWAPRLRVARRLLCRGIAGPAALEGIPQGRRPGLLWGDFALQGTSVSVGETMEKQGVGETMVKPWWNSSFTNPFLENQTKANPQGLGERWKMKVKKYR